MKRSISWRVVSGPLRWPDHSPMRIDKLGPEMPGLFSTQSVHKQGAGFSQASQIHARDEHLRGQKRYVEHKRFNESFLMNATCAFQINSRAVAASSFVSWQRKPASSAWAQS